MLGPSGALALVFNTRDPASELQHDLTELLRPYGISTSWMRDLDPVAALQDSGLFGRPEYAEFRHEQRFDVDGLVERVTSISYVALLEGREREDFLAQVRELGERQAESPFAFPYVSQVWVSRVAGGRR